MLIFMEINAEVWNKHYETEDLSEYDLKPEKFIEKKIALLSIQ